MDEELLSNLLNTSAILSKILTSLYFFSCLNLALAPLLFYSIFYYYDSKGIYGNVAFTRMHRKGKRQEDRGASRCEADIWKFVFPQPCQQQTTH